MLQTQFRLRELARRMLLVERPDEVFQTLARLLQAQLDLAQQTCHPVIDALHHFIDVGRYGFGGYRRRRRTMVGDEIGDREIDLVTDAGDQRQRVSGDVAGQRFVVETPEILE